MLENLLQLVCSLWVASELALLILRRAKGRDQSRDSGSVVWLNITIYGSIASAIAIAFSGIGFATHSRYLVSWVGLFFILCGLAIRWTAILTLRKYFTVNVAIQSGQRMVTTGIFRFVRRPSYSGALLSFLGLALTFTNVISIVVLLVPTTMAFVERMRIEEKAMIDAFGTEYAEYCRSTWRLIPGIY
jgi:protein-S-isoprenylcysteine O-methyltransferase